MSPTTSVRNLNEPNYRTWAIEAKDLLKHLNVWRVVDGSGIVTQPPTPLETTASTADAADTKATGTISRMLQPSLRSRYMDEKFDDPKVLWDRIQSDFDEIIKLDGEYEMGKLTTCKLKSYPSVTEWITAQEQIINHLAICSNRVEER
ncbi:hypothetical protein BDD12DRAFT_898355 [Trichophaea hybrida]|nr:hypothetical protein BDD12DRAFT_898355 [Trichophaea hybrida]